MLAPFILSLREGIEMALVVGVILGVLRRAERRELNRFVALGVLCGLAASIAAAVLFERLAGGFEGRAEQVFEGSTMLFGALLVTFAVLWASAAGRRGALERRAAEQLPGAAALGIFLLVFLSILREGAELVIFLAASRFGNRASVLLGASLGLGAAASVGVLLSLLARSGLRALFAVTTLILVLFAAGLVSRGLHELSEAGLLPPIVERIWDINPPPRADGGLPPLHEDGSIGGILRSLFGYTGAPSALELIGWVGYLAVAGALAGARRARRAQAERAAMAPDDSAA